MPEKFPVLATIARLWGIDDPVHLRTGQVLWVAVCTAVLLALPRTLDNVLWYALAFTTVLIASPMLQRHYLSLLLLPFAACLTVAARLPRSSRARQGLLTTFWIGALLFNFDASLFVGPAWSRSFQGIGAPAFALLIFWLCQLVSAMIIARASRVCT
jgi:hypothetical protein